MGSFWKPRVRPQESLLVYWKGIFLERDGEGLGLLCSRNGETEEEQRREEEGGDSIRAGISDSNFEAQDHHDIGQPHWYVLYSLIVSFYPLVYLNLLLLSYQRAGVFFVLWLSGEFWFLQHQIMKIGLNLFASFASYCRFILLCIWIYAFWVPTILETGWILVKCKGFVLLLPVNMWLAFLFWNPYLVYAV